MVQESPARGKADRPHHPGATGLAAAPAWYARAMDQAFLTREQAREIDRVAITQLGYPGPVLMENAGRGCVDVMERIGVRGGVLVLCGKGNNAGDGFVIARHLAIRGYQVKVALGGRPERLRGDARTAFDMLTPCGITILDLGGVHAGAMIEELDELSGDTEWIVDALLGTGAVGPPRPPLDALIDWMNAERAADWQRQILAVDTPSGLDCDTGRASDACVRATHTATFAAAKVGFREKAAAAYLGRVHVVDIGLPAPVLRRVLDGGAQA
ncbi:MAG: NAD(P)H-hydrate epimerase [Planctomycetota bacterium]